ncbi:MAG: hypothetical protein GY705_22425, partial [Bacteroidetes bacterium]|nr:hypothetical protein [Bacteroidota bacterium]
MIKFSHIFTVSHQSLRLMAALVWYGGSIALLWKAFYLLSDAKALKPEVDWLWGAVLGGSIIGTLKGQLLFNRSCQRNLARINALVQPQVWQFFKPSFFLFLAIMIIAGATLSRLA